MQRVDRPVDRPGAGKGSEILPFDPLRTAMLGDPRKIMPFAEQDEGKALIIAQQDIVGGPELLDQLRF